MVLRYVTVDVFTDQPFGGNPLAVVLGGERLGTGAMQSIAREFNYSETTFVLPPADPAHHARVRIFTPGQELPFAGHPNVGTAFVLALERMRRGEAVPERFLFEEAAGLVPVRVLYRHDAVVGAELTAPARFEAGRRFDPGEVARAIGLSADRVRVAAHPPLLGSVGLPFLLVELEDAGAVQQAGVTRERITALIGRDGERAAGIYLYARETGQRLQARMFAPLDGIDEDPATGSAAAALGGLLAGLPRTGGSQATLVLYIAQGVAMGRPSRLLVTVDGGEVRVAGDCVPMMSGELAQT